MRRCWTRWIPLISLKRMPPIRRTSVRFWRRIMAVMRGTDRGADGVNAVVMRRMRACLAATVHSFAETGDLDMKHCCAMFFSDIREVPRARALYEDVIAGYAAQLGDRHTETQGAKMNLGCLLEEHGEPARARAV